MLVQSHAKNELNDHIVSIHIKKVAGKKALIEEAKFFVLNSTTDDPVRAQFVHKLMVLNEDLARVMDDLTKCELVKIE